MKKLITVLLVVWFFMGFTASALARTFSENVTFDHDHAVSSEVYDCPGSLNYTFLSESVALPQFDPSLGVLTSVELVVESSIDVETYYYYNWNYAHSNQWWYSNVVASVEGLEATIPQDHNYNVIGRGDHDHAFTIDGVASDFTLSDLANFIGTGSVDVSLTGNNKLCAWWNRYTHYDTDTYGSVRVSLNYDYYIPVNVDIKPGSCPNPLNLEKKGVLPTAILGSMDLDVTDLDLESIRLMGVPPLRSTYEDVATPFHTPTGKGDCLQDCTSEEKDGYTDLTLKFDAQEVAAALIEEFGDVAHKDCVVLTITGNLSNGSPIQGEDVVSIRRK